MNEIHIAPNRPVFVALKDPAGTYDFDLQRGTYETTAGQTLVLPRPAVQALNMVGPAKGEEIEILQSWTGRQGDRPEWSIRLTNGSEKARAAAELAQDSAAEPGRLENPPEPIRSPTPIRKTTKEAQPGLFDTRGTGTYGPMPAARAYAAPKLVNRRPPALPQIPANVAFREITRFVFDGLQANGLQWGVDAQQAMVCTVMIAEYKAGRIGPWERVK
jgi:hypothetical protein